MADQSKPRKKNSYMAQIFPDEDYTGVQLKPLKSRCKEGSSHYFQAEFKLPDALNTSLHDRHVHMGAFRTVTAACLAINFGSRVVRKTDYINLKLPIDLDFSKDPLRDMPVNILRDLRHGIYNPSTYKSTVKSLRQYAKEYIAGKLHKNFKDPPSITGKIDALVEDLRAKRAPKKLKSTSPNHASSSFDSEDNPSVKLPRITALGGPLPLVYCLRMDSDGKVWSPCFFNKNLNQRSETRQDITQAMKSSKWVKGFLFCPHQEHPGAYLRVPVTRRINCNYKGGAVDEEYHVGDGLKLAPCYGVAMKDRYTEQEVESEEEEEEGVTVKPKHRAEYAFEENAESLENELMGANSDIAPAGGEAAMEEAETEDDDDLEDTIPEDEYTQDSEFAQELEDTIPD